MKISLAYVAICIGLLSCAHSEKRDIASELSQRECSTYSQVLAMEDSEARYMALEKAIVACLFENEVPKNIRNEVELEVIKSSCDRAREDALSDDRAWRHDPGPKPNEKYEAQFPRINQKCIELIDGK